MEGPPFASGAGRPGRWPIVLSAAVLLTAGAFALDLRIPLGYAGGMLYVVPVLLGLWLPDRRITLAIAGVATGLTVVGYFASGGSTTITVLLNRGGAILAVWIVAAGVLLYRRAQAGLAHQARELQQANTRLGEENDHRSRLEGSLRAAITELEHKNAELERFTYTVSHDLKSPLITIKGFLGVLERDMAEGNTERVAQDIERIAKAAERMEQLLDELLELSRIGRIVNPPQDVPLGELMHETLEMLSGPLNSRPRMSIGAS
ncbi:MAG: histidine kinase dimerization/phospho-acceptor domain-containing protein [Polyangiales bacterium]